MYGRFQAHVDTRNAYLEDQAQRAAFEAAAKSPLFAYARHREGATCIYHTDAKSPTGVLMAVGYWSPDGTAWAVGVLDACGRAFPLSPTEGLNKSGARA